MMKDGIGSENDHNNVTIISDCKVEPKKIIIYFAKQMVNTEKFGIIFQLKNIEIEIQESRMRPDDDWSKWYKDWSHIVITKSGRNDQSELVISYFAKRMVDTGMHKYVVILCCCTLLKYSMNLLNIISTLDS